MGILDSVIEETNDGPKVVRKEDNPQNINWKRGTGDVAEMIKLGGDMASAANSRAQLAVIDGQVAVIYTADTDAWHELGSMVNQAMSMEDLFRLCPALDFTVEKVPIYCQDGQVEGMFAVVRVSKSGDRKPFKGVTVGTRQTLVQIRESLGFLDEAIGSAGAVFETAGAIEDGRKIFITAKMPQWIEPVKGDEVHHWMAMTDSFDGTETGRWFSCENRMVCKNTRRIEMANGRDFYRFRHTASIHAKMKDAANAFQLAAKQWDRYAEHADAMVAKEVVPHHFANDVLDCVLDITAAESKKGASVLAATLDVTQAEMELAEKSFERKIARRDNILLEILERHESERNTAPGTVWGAYNAVTEYANHGIKYRGEGRKQAESRFESVLTGRADEINQAAYSTAVEAISA